MLIFILSFKIIFYIYSLKIEDTKLKEILNKTNKIIFNNKNEDFIEISNYTRINPLDKNYFYLPIIGSSDIHGHFYPEEIEIRNISYSKGGLDYLAKYINIIRKEFQNNVLYLDAGDLFQGGIESTITKGDIILDYLNLIQPDAVTFGNHEFDDDRKILEDKIKKANFAFLSANIYDSKTNTKKAFGENHFTSKIYTFKVINNDIIDEIKIGVIGLTIKRKENQISGYGYDGIMFLEYKEELILEANKLREQNKVHAIILLSHIGLNCEGEDNLILNMYKPLDEQSKCDKEGELYKLINELDEGIIDAVVAGHSHKIVHHYINNIPIISAINNGLYSNIIYLAFERKNNYKIKRDKIRIEGPLPICEKIFKGNKKCEYIKQSKIKDYLPLVKYKFHDILIEKDHILQSIHDKYDNNYNILREKICSIVGIEDTLTIQKNGSFYLGNIIADIQSSITGADISISSYGNLRGDWNPGHIPLVKIKDLIPYKNNLCTFTMNGNEIKKMIKIIQKGIKKYFIISGLKQIFSKNNKGEYILTNIKFFNGYKEFELISEKEYLITANDFLIKRGGDDFIKVLMWYKPRNLNCDYGLDIDLIEKYLRDHKLINVRKYMNFNHPRIRFID